MNPLHRRPSPAGGAPPRRWSGRSRRAVAAYTAVELLMSMAVLSVGVVGIIGMEKISISSNMHAKNLAVASHIAQAWLGVLEAEASLWGSNGQFTRTTWLAQGAGQATWFRPNYDNVRLFGPAFDALGNPVVPENIANARFCVDLRFSPLNTTTDGTGLIRTEVRVIWLREQAFVSGGVTPPSQPCGVAAANVGVAAQSRLFHFVFLSGAVRQVVPL